MENEAPKSDQKIEDLTKLEHRVNDALQPLLIWVEATQLRLDLVSQAVASLNRAIAFNRNMILGFVIMVVIHMALSF